MTVAAYTGTFDPVHLGHLAVIETAATMFDEVIVVVLGNPSKRSGLLDVPTRVDLLERSITRLANVRCVSHRGLAADAVRAAGASIIVRSVHKERDDELVMAATNRAVGGIGTGFVRPPMASSWISSSTVRTLLAEGHIDDACAMVPAPVAEHLRSVAG